MPFPWNEQSIPNDFISPHEIVVASDLSNIEELLPHVSVQARACRARVTLVYALEFSNGRREQELEEELYARQILGQARQALEMDGVRSSVVVRKGEAAEVVDQEIARTKAGRLIAGTHWQGPRGPNMIGTVANALLLTATVPVFVIPPGMKVSSAHACPHKILHPVVPSGSYRESMCFSAEVARACGAELTFLYMTSSPGATGSHAKVLETRMRHDIEDYIWPPALHVRTHLECGDFVPTILHLSASENMDWIVMGMNHNCRWWSKQNSHTYQVIAESHRPVLTFHNRILTPIHTADSSAEEVFSA